MLHAWSASHSGPHPVPPAHHRTRTRHPRHLPRLPAGAPDENDFESPEYDARILEAQAAFVDRFSPGILRWVDAPHFMEPVVPDVIADAVREVDRLSSLN